ncbi:MAG: type II toxin-antitoxin system HicB family antitoxin [Chloroflexi bacterium]|nr:type II toxin-antitoxin system HicB family antitoxin [Chloroflexota bacterium]MCY3696815.1 type II toxin-antitoxin system HicB family antitoxin [Chloroflexota bacterium]
MLRCQTNVLWSDEEDMYVAVAPELPGRSALGDRCEDALPEMQVAIALWIDTAEEFSNPIPLPDCHPVAP